MLTSTRPNHTYFANRISSHKVMQRAVSQTHAVPVKSCGRSHSCAVKLGQRQSSSVKLGQRQSNWIKPGQRQRLSPVCSSDTGSPAAPSEEKLAGLSFTSRRAWTLMRETLKASGVKFLSPQEANFARERGAVLIDVRTSGEYANGHIPRAVNAPFFQPIVGWTPFKVARRLGFAFFGVFNGTEYNSDFINEVRAIIPDPDTEVIVYCAYGGSIESTDNTKHGNQTRATIAAYILVEDGNYTNVSVMKGGFSDWEGAGREVETLDE